MLEWSELCQWVRRACGSSMKDDFYVESKGDVIRTYHDEIERLNRKRANNLIE